MVFQNLMLRTGVSGIAKLVEVLFYMTYMIYFNLNMNGKCRTMFQSDLLYCEKSTHFEHRNQKSELSSQH
jgi:hypothetical protein